MGESLEERAKRRGTARKLNMGDGDDIFTIKNLTHL